MSETFRAPELDWAELDALLNGRHGAPFAVLGPRPLGDGTLLRTLQPRVSQVTVLGADQQSYPLARVHNSDLFEGLLPSCAGPQYRLQLVEGDISYEIDDPYRFPLQLSDFDLHLIGKGTHYTTYLKLGAHLTTIDGVAGVEFAVWAPNAQRVSVLGDWNWWDGRVHPMQPRDSGIWELFIPGLSEGSAYKYELRSHSGHLLQKSDPYGFYAEFRPKTASIVWHINKHHWQDDAWMRQREQRQSLAAPIAIYECHLGSWQRGGDDQQRYLSFRELAQQLIPYVTRLGYTHIELLPISEHPFDGSWGYQTVGYYAPTSRHGTPDDFQFFVDQCHQAGLGVILDWVPAHFPKDAHGLITFDGTHLYEHADPRQGEHPDWGTLIFNYGRNEVRNFLLSNALFWLDMYHIDGFRVDAVSSMLYLDYGRQPGAWVANQYGGRENLEAIEFLQQFNLLVHSTYPGVLTIAEESTAWPLVSRPVDSGGLGFSFKWNMGWMHDTLNFMQTEPIIRSQRYNQLTFSLMYAFSENFVLSLSHDEVVHLKRALLTKMPGDDWQRFANVRSLFGYLIAHPGKKLLFMGMEFGQWGEWNHDTSLDWHLLDWEPHQGLQRLLADLNALYRQETALHTIDFDWSGFEWLQVNDPGNCVLAFLRRGVLPDDEIVIVCNWKPIVHNQYWVRAPRSGAYRELLNTDAAIYWGGGVNNPGPITTHSAEDGQHYLQLRLPPLAVVLLKPIDQQTELNTA